MVGRGGSLILAGGVRVREVFLWGNAVVERVYCFLYFRLDLVDIIAKVGCLFWVGF